MNLNSFAVRRVNSLGIAYGDCYCLDDEDVPCAVREAVETDAVETGEDDGAVTVGGQGWTWSKS